jgi:hypothetical protein
VPKVLYRQTGIFLSLAVVFFLSACSAPVPVTNEVIEVTRVVIHTMVVTELVEQTIIITATPEPPTPTPEITPTPQFALWDAAQVVDAFKSAGLEAEGTYQMTKDDYGAAPMMATEGIRFLIPSICADCGGRILEFDNLSGLAATQIYYEELGKQSAWFFSWVLVKDNILVQINGKLPEDKATQYQEALEDLQ